MKKITKLRVQTKAVCTKSVQVNYHHKENSRINDQNEYTLSTRHICRKMSTASRSCIRNTMRSIYKEQPKLLGHSQSFT
jgi:hypothetical protein